MTYTGEPRKAPGDELKATIPGWGIDLDPADRPSVPQSRYDPGATGAHWDFPERQEERWPRERSNEHRFLTPVFGTAVPPSGLSGAIRRFAYRYSEARAAHWLLLLAADRVNVVESRVSAVTADRGITDGDASGAGRTVHGALARSGTDRIDRKHAWMDPIVVSGPWLVAGGTVVAVLYGVARKTGLFGR